MVVFGKITRFRNIETGSPCEGLAEILFLDIYIKEFMPVQQIVIKKRIKYFMVSNAA